MMRRKNKDIIKKVGFYLFASAIAAFILMPFFWMISTSLKDKGALMVIPIQWIPEEISFEGYKKVFTLFPFSRAIINSALVAVLSTLVSISSAAMAAYAFAKIDFKGREKLFGVYLATMMIPVQVTTIPIFIVLAQVKLVNTFTGLILPSIFNAFAVFMLRQQMKTIPNDYIDAATIDGASQISAFNRIILPMCKPVIATLVIISFMGYWNDYYWPLIILSDKNKMTLPLALNQLNGQYSSDYNTLMAGSLLSMLPIIIIYASAQKYFQSGLQLGGIKG